MTASETIKDTALPRILVFSTNNISDPGVDLAGSAHLHYSPNVVTISVPCSSGIRPSLIEYALQEGFDGVFVAADGEECAYLSDCSERTARNLATVQQWMEAHHWEPQRLRMGAICSVCAESFVSYVQGFSHTLAQLGPRGGQDHGV
ncbi:MAG: hydrogenase iron-sulfur subunit [Firmicutes bacterium]|jgi:coenzyme F420-reducing hydrogenase delta subunit|nr:hydrogenase iron-sulfur subunit [Bacillota bacterium]